MKLREVPAGTWVTDGTDTFRVMFHDKLTGLIYTCDEHGRVARDIASAEVEEVEIGPDTLYVKGMTVANMLDTEKL